MARTVQAGTILIDEVESGESDIRKGWKINAYEND
jgi:hypothetical protein